MKASFHWINQLLPDLKATPPEIADLLTDSGIEVEGLHFEAESLADIVVAEVKSVGPHPSADNLQVAHVFDGAQDFQVVTGGPDVAPGQKVALGRVGARLPRGETIELREIRGVTSQGMLCSAAELGLAQSSSGIYLLKARVRPGKALASVLGLDDVIFEVSPTPNRADVLSHYGLARELAALTGLSPPVCEPRFREDRRQAATWASVSIREPSACPLYLARIITGVAVGPSPDWLVHRLALLGVRSISNVVDVTNLVLLELGHPLHAFDLDQLSGRTVVVRRAKDQEELTTLDGTLRKLNGDDLVIADQDKPVALAGVMGGKESSVTESTVNILLESALFDPRRVRVSARRHGLHTDASHRFERGVDPARLQTALDRATELLIQLCDGTVERGVLSAGKGVAPPPVVAIRPSRATRLLGRSVDKQEVRTTLESLGLKRITPERGAKEVRALKRSQAKALSKIVPSVPKTRGLRVALDLADALYFQVPSWRVDLVREEDLIEEIARFGGFDAILAQMPPLPRPTDQAAESDSEVEFERTVKTHLVQEGFLESIALAFNARTQVEWLGLPSELAVEVANPLGEESALMRMSLVPGLLRAARYNQDMVQGLTSLRLFEVGRTFAWDPKASPNLVLPTETLRATFIMRGDRVPASWASKDEKGLIPAVDAYDVKAVVESLLSALRMPTVAWVPTDVGFLHPRSRTSIEREGRSIGLMGELHPDVMTKFGLEGPPVFVAELTLDALRTIHPAPPLFTALAKTPSARRDLSFLIQRDIPAAQVVKVIEQAGVSLDLESVSLFDVYEGQGMPVGKRSLAVTLIFRAKNRTLTDGEVEAARARIMTELESTLGAEIRA